MTDNLLTFKHFLKCSSLSILLLFFLSPSLAFSQNRVVIAYSCPSDHVDLLDQPSKEPFFNAVVTAKIVSDPMRKILVSDIKTFRPNQFLITASDPFNVRFVDLKKKSPNLFSGQPFFNFPVYFATVHSLVRESKNGNIEARFLFSPKSKNSDGTISAVDSGNGEIFFSRGLTTRNDPFAVVAAVTLADGKVAIASNGSDSEGVSKIDIFRIADLPEGRTQLADKIVDGLLSDAVIVNEINGLRGLYGYGIDAPKDLLIVTRSLVMRYRLGNGLIWKFDPMSANLAGEFSAATLFSDGTVAVSMFDPGRISSPSDLHRIVWLAPDGTYHGVRSASLDCAPIAIDNADGVGATGSVGFKGIEYQKLSVHSPKIQLAELLLARDEFSINDRVSGEAHFSVDVSVPSLLPDVVFYAEKQSEPDKACTHSNKPRRIELGRVSGMLAGKNDLIVSFKSEKMTRSDAGAWCAWASLQLNSDTRELKSEEDGVKFWVGHQSHNSASSDVDELKFKEIPFSNNDDMGGAGGDSLSTQNDDDDDGGCASLPSNHSTHSLYEKSLLLIILSLAFVGYRRKEKADRLKSK